MTRLRVYNGGFWKHRRILTLAGHRLATGWPKAGDAVAVWGMANTAWRGAAIAQRSKAPLWRVEDAFLRSVKTGREGERTKGILLDRTGIHFDPSQPSDLETLLQTEDFTPLLHRSKAAMARLVKLGLSKYNAHQPLDWACEGHVVVIDQTQGDAALRATQADRSTFLTMLNAARQNHPHRRIIVKTHPETEAGQRRGHFEATDLSEGEEFCTLPLSPQQLFQGAEAVYTVSSQMGFEAIWAGHRPYVFGGPFYAGWGLSEDVLTFERRTRHLTATELFAGAMILAPLWYCQHRDRLASLEEVIDALEAEKRAYQEDCRGWDAYGMRLWKRAPLQRAFGYYGKLRFKKEGAKSGGPAMAWAGRPAPEGAVTVEDGFLRSKGLGAALTPPSSLILDPIGIYFDATRPSQLEALIAKGASEAEKIRAAVLLGHLTQGGVSKYNLAGKALPALPEGRRILVPGQVEDDASLRFGTGDIRTNEALLKAVRQANPDAVILWKPHPDVEAGLRTGAVNAPQRFADVVLEGVDAISAIEAADEIWTMTSTLGFEALLRGKAVTTFGRPFYAGWGLTTDLCMQPERRSARPDLLSFAHAALIAYPRYFDPQSGRPCAPEVVVEKLASSLPAKRGLANRLLAKAQGALASYAWIWRHR